MTVNPYFLSSGSHSDPAWDAARDAAWDAAWAALAPAVSDLQASVLDLFDRMLPTEILEVPVVAEVEWKTLCRVNA